MVSEHARSHIRSTRKGFDYAHPEFSANCLNVKVAAMHEPPPHRLLVQIDPRQEDMPTLRYALDCAQRTSRPVEICLALVEHAGNPGLLRFSSETTRSRQNSEVLNRIFRQASDLLARNNLPCRIFYREGETLSGLLGLAEELCCNEIVIHPPEWQQLLGSMRLRSIRPPPSGVHLTLVDRHGAAID